jgi:hypothetical protein
MEIYPSFKPKSQEDSLVVWGLVVSELTNKQIINGLEICRTDISEPHYAPPPAIFKLWCHGLLSSDSAYFKAVKEKKEIKIPEIWHAACLAGMLGNYPCSISTQEKKRFESAYATICKQRMAGQQFLLPENRQDRLVSLEISRPKRQNDDIVTQDQLLFRQLEPKNKRWRNKLVAIFGNDSAKVKEFDELLALPVNEIINQGGFKSCNNLIAGGT